LDTRCAELVWANRGNPRLHQLLIGVELESLLALAFWSRGDQVLALRGGVTKDVDLVVSLASPILFRGVTLPTGAQLAIQVKNSPQQMAVADGFTMLRDGFSGCRKVLINNAGWTDAAACSWGLCLDSAFVGAVTDMESPQLCKFLARKFTWVPTDELETWLCPARRTMSTAT
jgi:hypothetical protein